MPENTTLTIKFAYSGEKKSVSLKMMTSRACLFLETFGTEMLTDQTFADILGTGDGASRLENLIDAAGFQNDTKGFFKEVLDRLTRPGQTDFVINEIELPHLFLVSLLEVVLPGNGWVTIKTVDQLVKETNLELADDQKADLQKVIEMYPVRLSRHTIRQMMVSKDVAYQYMPFVEELEKVGHTNTWIGQFHQGLLEQMYQNRVIFLLNMSCPVYCRFCFRKHKESRNEANPTVEDIKTAIEHVRRSPSIKEIVVTGGDPFLSRGNMEAAIDGLMDIPHVQTLRLATRSVAYYPHLFLKDDGAYLKYLKEKNLELQRHDKRMEIATHFIHPDEISPESLSIINEFVNNGITVYIQTPFLQHCNDKGPELQRLFRLLRGAGAEIHYIYIPCSPIHGNSVYWSPLSDGIDIAEYLRANLSDRSIPKICTATPIGKMEWYTSGWAVEPVEDKEGFLWIRTPYTPEYFKSFAPLANELPNIRVNEEGTLDIQYMARMGKDSYFLGSRPLRILPNRIPKEVPEHLQVQNLRPSLAGQSIVTTGLELLKRVHATRVEMTTEAGPRELEYIRSDHRITDVIITAEDDVPGSLHVTSELIKELRTIDHLNAVRLRSLKFQYEPGSFTPTVLRRLGDMNRLTVSRPLRLEIETWALSANDITDAHRLLTRELNSRGITVYSNTPLLGGINDFPQVIADLTFAYRKAGIEFHHLYVAGRPAQIEWNSRNPVDMYTVVDIASKIRREGSGREGPRYIIQSPLGEVYYGLTSSFRHDGDDIIMKMDSYSLNYYKDLDPDFTLPAGIRLAEDGSPEMVVPGLVSSTEFPI